MIGKNQFYDLIINYKVTNKEIDKLCDLICNNIFENKIIQSYWQLFDDFVNSHFTEEATDTIMWWLLEREDGIKNSVTDKNGEEIPMDTIDDLWNYVENEQK